MVDIRSEVNRELVMRLVSDVSNGNRFYTDLNGFQVCEVMLLAPPTCLLLIADWLSVQMQQRRSLSKLPTQANFFPMSSAAFVQDSTSRLSLLSAQSQAVAALRPGESVLVVTRQNSTGRVSLWTFL